MAGIFPKPGCEDRLVFIGAVIGFVLFEKALELPVANGFKQKSDEPDKGAENRQRSYFGFYRNGFLICK